MKIDNISGMLESLVTLLSVRKHMLKDYINNSTDYNKGRLDGLDIAIHVQIGQIRIERIFS